MKYLFFDVECSNCFNGNGKICEFGYVLTDDSFNLLNKNEYVMSPGRNKDSRFHLKGRKDQKDIQLAYEEEYYYSQPEFPQFYQNIKNLMEDPETICFAWSSDNDILHLYHTCKRYKKNPIKYICYDMQKVAQKYLGNKNQLALKAACDTIVGPNCAVRLQEHLSSDDALMTMKIFEALCVLKQINSEELLLESNFAKDDSIKFIDEFMIKRKQKQEIERRHELYKKESLQYEEKLDDPQYMGKRINLSGNTKKKVDSIENLLEIIKNEGFAISNSLCQTDIFVCFDEEDYSEVKNKLENTDNLEFVLLKDFFNK